MVSDYLLMTSMGFRLPKGVEFENVFDEEGNFKSRQPERSKREDLINELDKFTPKSLNEEDGYFPPPWNANDFPEKTLGWLEFQKAMKKDPQYYLGCGALNSQETD